MNGDRHLCSQAPGPYEWETELEISNFHRESQIWYLNFYLGKGKLVALDLLIKNKKN